MRLKKLDFLRGIAIILVIFRHHNVSTFMANIGWVGVDLFFVLSGFLVTGLLIAEYKKFNTVKPMRFLIRRGFKIYPLFYLCILISVILFAFYFKTALTNEKYLAEVLFFQNYVPGIWDHTWSLAVEEHFYVSLAILFFLFIKIKKIKAMIKRLGPVLLFSIVAFTIVLLRIFQYNYFDVFDGYKHIYPTHIRFDSLLFGSLLSYLYHYKHDTLKNFVSDNRFIVLIVSLFLLLTPILFQIHEKALLTIGYTLIYLGFGGILLFTLFTDYYDTVRSYRWGGYILNSVSVIGFYSYSIYLFHVPYRKLYSALMEDFSIVLPNKYVDFAVFLFGSILIGVFFSFIVEKPFLKLRDRFFPSRSSIF